jgi:succinoglycan biosynthesis protein ExoA
MIAKNGRLLISVVVPCRNERESIERALSDILGQDLGDMDMEVIVADGMSDDGTGEILERLSAADERIRVLRNPKRIVSTGLNAAIKLARGDIVLRMDVHTDYARDYLSQCVRVLVESGADNVGGPARTRSRSYFQAANGLAYHAWFAVGGAKFHDVNYEGFVDTVTYGCWWRDYLLEIGLFDEDLVRNQDDELNLRIRRAGGKIWQSPHIMSWYYPRSTLRSLFKQYAQYGYWKWRVIRKHMTPASVRHLVPATFVGVITLGAALSPFSVAARLVELDVLGGYVCVNVAASVWVSSRRASIRYLPVMPWIFGAYHLGYGFGFLAGCLGRTLGRGPVKRYFEGISR